MVATFPAQLPVTPAGKPTNIAPVAPVVAQVIVVIAVLIHVVWASVPTAELNTEVFSGVTVMIPVDVIVPQPPVNVIV